MASGTVPPTPEVPPLGRHLVLVGLSGTGKSTVAPRLAARLGCAAVDLDRRIEAESGRSIPEIFDRDGEEGFRALELAALERALAGAPVVVAAGGGLVTTEAARAGLRRCTVVWLDASIEELLERLEADGEERPLLAGDAATTLRRLHRQREALYREVADLHLQVGGSTPDQVVEQVLGHLRGA